ncbi:hypothetical protein GCM10010168_49370 [Actinoplanes ianthinogenes]|uniref:Uncharacterized protein n=1 Tax=Actinoplanes ianthinogenes TaxID=122358 RepID=A0ABM7M2X2_9ACTN|nr:hypothetical protein Aiant_66460 [Actinoplanes ianthinogenes]GGR25534.1 hypothetical protein GCM10010168_49370 [Actinoplanes ianthinogenes]
MLCLVPLGKPPRAMGMADGSRVCWVRRPSGSGGRADRSDAGTDPYNECWSDRRQADDSTSII